jgi:hypothetical protein
LQLKLVGRDGLEEPGEEALKQTAHGFDPFAITRVGKTATKT